MLCRTASPKTCHRRCARGFNWGTLPNECWDVLPGLAYSCLTSANGSLLPLISFQTDLKAQGRLEKEEKPPAADIEQSAPCLQDVLLCCCQPVPMRIAVLRYVVEAVGSSAVPSFRLFSSFSSRSNRSPIHQNSNHVEEAKTLSGLKFLLPVEYLNTLELFEGCNSLVLKSADTQRPLKSA